ncbi:MAG: hypothetical protein JAZ17_06335 [Candidatus Thiodiazotropha endolucinida]|nr:hypothetical protein [Candidatus Thiodiazotropha endolucinida]
MDVAKLEDKIRYFINSGRKQASLLKDSAAWNKLCSSLDVVGDTQLAIEAHQNFHETKGDGESYLIVYGVLQAMLLQQDAVKHIGNALNIKVKLPRQLEDIRIIRNSAAGHPAYQKENGLAKSSFITRISLSPVSFQLMTVYSGDRDYEFNQISIPSLIETQEQYVCEVMSGVVKELERQEMEHRKKHKETKLADSFPHTTRYHISKIIEATSSPDRFPLGDANVKTIEGFLDEFKQELEKRDEWGVYDSINYHYELIEYPIKRLKEYFNYNDPMNEKDAYIFASFISEQMDELSGIAQELDEKYESSV